MRKLLFTMILGIFILTLSACGKAPVENTLVVGMECAYAPYNWTTNEQTETSYPIEGTNQYCDGYDVKIARTIADELNLKLVIKSLDWDGLIPALNSNQIDAIIAGMSPTAKRQVSINFTDAYYVSADDSEQTIIVLASGQFKDANSTDDFNGARIGAQLGTLQDEEGLIEQLTGATHATPLADYASLVTALTNRTIDGFIAELPVALSITEQNNALKFVQFPEGQGFTLSPAFTTTAIGLRKSDTELRDQMNEVLDSISSEERTTWMNEFIDKSSAQ